MIQSTGQENGWNSDDSAPIYPLLKEASFIETSYAQNLIECNKKKFTIPPIMD
ncbi:MAG: hypothetical protein IPN46_15960 [Saprospiraceae bacterium]|nr:hypothetical protein [Saprospiraceae bacterium]